MTAPVQDQELALALPKRIITRAAQLYWRMTRSHTLGAQALVIDAEGQVLLVRHTYRPGWHFPGGGVELNQTLEAALERELEEETGLRPTERSVLIGIFANFQSFPSDHIALFRVARFERVRAFIPNREIAEARFFPRRQLPRDTTPGALRRLEEIETGTPPAPMW